MGSKFSYKEILKLLNKSISGGRPILAAGCSVGIIAKCAESGGADLIMVYSSGKARIRGLQTSLEENSNILTIGMFEEIQHVVERTPIIGGIDATDPSMGHNLSEVIGRFIDTGFSGIINFPTYGFFNDKEWRREREEKGIGFSREIELIRTASNMDVFTMAYVFFPEDATAMAKAGVHCMVPHAGGTAGGMVGFDVVASPLQESAITIQKIIEATKKVNPDIICLAHGGHIVEPEDTRYIYEHTDALGFVGASSIERIPIEKAVTSVVEKFKNMPLVRRT